MRLLLEQIRPQFDLLVYPVLRLLFLGHLLRGGDFPLALHFLLGLLLLTFRSGLQGHEIVLGLKEGKLLALLTVILGLLQGFEELQVLLALDLCRLYLHLP